MNKKQTNRQGSRGRKGQSSYHIVMIPDDSSQIHRVRLKAWQYRSGLVLMVGVVLALAVTSGGYLRYKSLYRKTLDMRKQYASLQADQSRLSQRLVHLEDTVMRAENLVEKVEFLVEPHATVSGQGVGPIDPVAAEPIGDTKKFADLSKMEPKQFTGQFSNLVRGLLDRSKDVEQKVTELYQSYQDRMVRLSSTPEIWPVTGWMTSNFGMRRHPVSRAQRFHEGIDIAAPWGMPVYSPGDGVVTFAGYKGGYGKTVVIDHGYGLKTFYSHNSKLLVKTGDKVSRGVQIAAVGNTGHSTGAHLHYEVHVDGVPVDPLNFLPPRYDYAARSDKAR